jgi:hypothetical protein
LREIVLTNGVIINYVVFVIAVIIQPFFSFRKGKRLGFVLPAIFMVKALCELGYNIYIEFFLKTSDVDIMIPNQSGEEFHVLFLWICSMLLPVIILLLEYIVCRISLSRYAKQENMKNKR